MRRFLRFLFISVLTGLFVAGAWKALEAQIPLANLKCPVMIGSRAKEKFFVDYKGRRIYLCCRPCVKAFGRNPEKYLKRMEQNEQRRKGGSA